LEETFSSSLDEWTRRLIATSLYHYDECMGGGIPDSFAEAELNEFRREMTVIYDFDTASQMKRHLIQYERFLKSGDDSKAHPVYYGYDDVAEEEIISEITSKLSSEGKNYEGEVTLGGHKQYTVDIIVGEVAIEAKSSIRSSIDRGIAQCKLYEHKGYKPILVTPIYWEEIMDMCNSMDIPLTLYDPMHKEFIPIVFEKGVSTVLE
jgi:hypothetical protein